MCCSKKAAPQERRLTYGAKVKMRIVMKIMLRILLIVNITLLMGCYGSGEIEPMEKIGTWTIGSDYREFYNEEWFYVGSRPVSMQGRHDAVLVFIFLVSPPYYELALLDADPWIPNGTEGGFIDVRFGYGETQRWHVKESRETMGVAIQKSREFMLKAMSAGTIRVRYSYNGKPIVCTFQMDGFKKLEAKYFPSLDGWSSKR